MSMCLFTFLISEEMCFLTDFDFVEKLLVFFLAPYGYVRICSVWGYNPRRIADELKKVFRDDRTWRWLICGNFL